MQFINQKDLFMDHMCGRLVLINKIHPKTPTINDIRPITVLSPIRKFLELQISDKIKSFCIKNINKAQTGFIENLGTDINLYRICNFIVNYNKKASEDSRIIFIDFKAAFDSVPHDKLLKIVYERKFLNYFEMDLLNFLLKNSYLEINGKKFRIRKGVPQGSIISPLLFDIFMDDLVTHLKKTKNFF